ncbi:pyridoxal phosphate-dependent transferase [Chaetomium fimeti]|uniref:Pyridoxal phosphate-dependent transferase n=1 Tax=Chaetomium fimeti TaxID=1854472 RepID=A0AAE0HCC3_9PEZI|nr:pyridoxal phosphate-dependent transferase [Chaetomium fimeti]
MTTLQTTPTTNTANPPTITTITTDTNPPQQPPPQTPKKKLINLLRGWPAPSLLPAAGLQAAATYVLSNPELAVPVLQYAPDPGYQPLREELARWLGGVYAYAGAWNSSGDRELKGGRGGGESGESGGGGSGSDGGNMTADEFAITGGASQALACVLQSFTDPGYTRAVWVVAPCYFLACAIFEDCGFHGRLRAVPEDEVGVDVGVLERRLRECEEEPWENHPSKHPSPDRKLYRHVIYLVATCANPSGKTMPLFRRQQLVHLARKHDALIISDDVYDLLQWPVSPTPPSPTTPSAPPSPLPPIPPLPLLSQIDAALPPSPHEPQGHTPHPRFGHAISNGSFSKLVGPGVRTGWIHASPGFAAGFAATGTNRSGGAASQFAAAIVWRFLSGVDAGVVAERARVEEELVVGPGAIFEVAGDEAAVKFPRNLRLSFSWVDEEDIVEGVARLGRVVRSVLEDGGKGGVGERSGKSDTGAFK